MELYNITDCRLEVECRLFALLIEMRLCCCQPVAQHTCDGCKHGCFAGSWDCNKRSWQSDVDSCQVTASHAERCFMPAGYYMHPAVADSSLHISAIPDRPTTESTHGRIPISLGVLAAPGRRNALLRTPWAGSASGSDVARFGGGSVTDDMTAVESAAAGYGSDRQSRLCFRSLVSRAVTSPSGGHVANRDGIKSQARYLHTFSTPRSWCLKLGGFLPSDVNHWPVKILLYDI